MKKSKAIPVLIAVSFLIVSSCSINRIVFTQAGQSDWYTYFDDISNSHYYFYKDTTSDCKKIDYPKYIPYIGTIGINSSKFDGLPVVTFDWFESGQGPFCIRGNHNPYVLIKISQHQIVVNENGPLFRDGKPLPHLDTISFDPVNSRLIINDTLVIPLVIIEITNYFEPLGRIIRYSALDNSCNKVEARMVSDFTAIDRDELDNSCNIGYTLSATNDDCMIATDKVRTLTLILDSLKVNGKNIYIEPLKLKPETISISPFN